MSSGCAINVIVNGKAYTNEVESRLLLVHYLRELLGLTGTHVGCDTSQCGSCTVLIDGLAVKSCTTFAAQADGSSILTIEGLTEGDQLHPLQEGFWEMHGLQCGFCTPGMVMTLYALLRENPRITDEQIRHGLAGNLCRCTGYENIVKAAQYGARKLRGEN
ncbi:MAG: carbon monoxide dehydrogenase [SAR202 cluster bacterium Io17-Chloro-G3]|nr:MAG: carbon monoxide dehydrogenase [SAR202 cluster bacterium Io17-Chloro-G3]